MIKKPGKVLNCMLLLAILGVDPARNLAKYKRWLYVLILFTTKLSPILIGLKWLRESTVFIRGETPSAQSSRPRKIPGWIVVVRESFPVNKRAYGK